MKKYLIVLVLIIMVSLGTFQVAFATDTTGGPPPANTTGGVPAPDTKGGAPIQVVPSLMNPLEANDVTSLFSKMIDVAIFLGLILAVLVFIFIGFKFVLAQGNDSKLKEAKTWFLYAVIGTAILISSKIIVDVVKNTFVSAGIVDEKVFNKP